MKKSEDFETKQNNYRAKILEQSSSVQSDIIVAHDEIEFSTIAYFERVLPDNTKFPEEKEREMYLIAAWFKNVSLTRLALDNGFYYQAAALIRQELELVTAINDLQKGNFKQGHTPNVGNNFPNLQTLYKNLSSTVHHTCKPSAPYGLNGLIL